MADNAIEEIKSRLDLAEVIGGYVPLKRSGRSLKGLCPFHTEKTPSFHVFPERGSWKCFGCGEGGDAFTFLQRKDNLDFVEALRMLATRTGVELPTRQFRATAEDSETARLQSLVAVAETYFRAALEGSAGAAARKYLEGRGVAKNSCERFGLGYAPRTGLLTHLRDRGMTVDDAVTVGVAGRSEDGAVYEFFRDRVIFPIRDSAGQTIGFGGRTLGDSQPKYLNGPQTVLFDKSETLFALDLARSAIRQSGQAIVVEGYMDALIAHQAGFENVVATLGTSLTERHLKALGRRAREIVLALDADQAGQNATQRGIDVIAKAPADAYVPVPDPGVRGLVRYQAVRGSQFRVLTLPREMDPDDLIRSDPDSWRKLVASASPAVDWLLTRLAERHDLSTPAGKQQAVDEALQIIRDLGDPVAQDVYLQRLATLVGAHDSVIRSLFSSVRPRSVVAGTAPRIERPEPGNESDAYTLALLLLTQREHWLLEAEDLTGSDARAVLSALVSESEEPTDALKRLEQDLDVWGALGPCLARVEHWRARLFPLPPEERLRELRVASLKLRQERLRREHREALDMIATPDEQAGQPDSAPIENHFGLLARIAASLRETEAALAKSGGVGSVVWRSRRAREVHSG